MSEIYRMRRAGAVQADLSKSSGEPPASNDQYPHPALRASIKRFGFSPRGCCASPCGAQPKPPDWRARICDRRHRLRARKRASALDHQPIRLSDSKLSDSTRARTMNTSNPSLLSFVRRMTGSLAIGPILREEYLYEVHGPFVAVAPVRPTRSFSRRLVDRLAASMRGVGSRREDRGQMTASALRPTLPAAAHPGDPST